MKSIGYNIIEKGIKIAGFKKLFMLDAKGLSSYVDGIKDKRKTTPPKRFYKKFKVSEQSFCDKPCYIISPKEPKNSEKAVFFIHGGGFFLEASALHWMAILN